MPKLLVATRNSHKTAEIQAISGSAWEITDLSAYPDVPSPEETGETFAENAAIKALAASERFAGLAIADDSGLEVDALAGAPGVRSARYAGVGASDAENRAKLLGALEMGLVRGKSRSARFRCVIVAAKKGQVLGTFEGAVEGMIINQERGAGGFGYDAIFLPAGQCETFGQLPGVVKNQLSHRFRALSKFFSALHTLE